MGHFNSIRSDLSNHQYRTRMETVPIESEAEMIQTTNRHRPRESAHMPPPASHLHEHDDGHGDTEADRYYSTAHLIRKSP